MIVRKFLFTAALAAFACPAAAAAAVTVLGSSSARMCYLNAENGVHTSPASLDDCNVALATEGLTETDRVATHVNRGILQLRLGRLDAAVADFDAAIARDPDQAEAYLNKGMAALRQEGGWEQALALFDTALAKQTSRPELAFYGRAVANEMGGRVKAAYLDYRQASVLAPKWSEPKTELARFTVRQP
ncbi:tetratricopeptide repeat protein [Sphingosinicella sp. BN140058]|uniref:tetratricopeptide repeat protein n=1 Tax=Sphingosinicella sp. BN140058 TaxID=1892855 RepID=UPI0010110319|nr:tetratricopeptide repeat protein [Sphingosinicella sp. BN140058]QAY78644.1 tetratricopeptide repeat protein [Sphingosinicella sp. BN140058]